MIRNGADIKQVSELMGHADIKTTLKHYYHVLPAARHEAVSHLPKIAG
jgi:site-specific recombinase XerD